MDLTPLMKPKSIGVIGASQRIGRATRVIVSLQRFGYAGRIFPIVAVDEDVDPSNINQVLWAMATRCNPVDDIDILRNTWSTWLDPTQNPPENRPYGSKALINACMEHKHIKQFARRTRVRRSVYESVARRWSELGYSGAPPKLWALEE